MYNSTFEFPSEPSHSIKSLRWLAKQRKSWIYGGNSIESYESKTQKHMPKYGPRFFLSLQAIG